MEVLIAAAARAFGLPPTATESEVRAAIAAYEPDASRVFAELAPRPAAITAAAAPSGESFLGARPGTQSTPGC